MQLLSLSITIATAFLLHRQAIVAAPDVAKEYSQQIVETEHLLKALLEQPNGK
jgi:ATP-dependent Clp protease ATP-binding subunit ClpA